MQYLPFPLGRIRGSVRQLLSHDSRFNRVSKKMASTEVQNTASAKRARFAGPSGIKGIIHNGKTTAIALFAALGGFVYGCEQSLNLANHRRWFRSKKKKTNADVKSLQTTRECSVRS